MDKEAIGSVKPLYTDLNIPTKLFFDILNSKVYSLLGEGSEEELQRVFEKIFDEYVDLGGNNEIKKWYADNVKLESLKIVESQTKILLYTILYTPMTTEELDLAVEILNGIKKLNANFDLSKDIVEECNRVNTKCLGSLRNEINMLNISDNKEKKVSENKAYIFQQDLARISITLGFQIASNLTMYEFITYKNSALESIKQSKQTNKA